MQWCTYLFSLNVNQLSSHIVTHVIQVCLQHHWLSTNYNRKVFCSLLRLWLVGNKWLFINDLFIMESQWFSKTWCLPCRADKNSLGKSFNVGWKTQMWLLLGIKLMRQMISLGVSFHIYINWRTKISYHFWINFFFQEDHSIAIFAKF